MNAAASGAAVSASDQDGGGVDSVQTSIAMLRDVLDGQTYEAVAARLATSRSSVERRVKSLAVHLVQAFPVNGIGRNGAAYVQRLRQHRQEILETLECFDPAQLTSQRESRVLTAEEVEFGALRVRARSLRRQHDLALYYLPFATGLRPLEVARLEVRDYLQEDGRIRRESLIRSDVAINGRERPLFFTHRRLDDHLQAYLEERQQAGHSIGSSDRWRALEPHSPLFLDVDGTSYAITPNGDAWQHRYVCRQLLDAYRKIFRQADIQGLCVQSARLTLMSRMYERGADEEQVGLVLGIADRSAVREQLPRPRPALAQTLEDLA